MNVVAESTQAAPQRTLNPAPKRRVDIRMTLGNAPGPFAVVKGVAQYDVSNAAECGKDNPISGAVSRMSSNEEFVLSRVSDTEYAGTLYVDQILDEDYYGNGVCHWQLAEARVVLQATPDARDTSFLADLPATQIEDKGEKTKYFWKGYYARPDLDGYTELGNTDLKRVQERVPDAERDAVFTITLAATERAS